jgi:signal transduction histidine kinase
MNISIRRKVMIAFAAFILAGGLIWFLNYYKHDILNRKLQIIEEKDVLLNTVLEARRYEKNYFLSLEVDSLRSALSYILQAEAKMHYIIDYYGKYTVAQNLDQITDELQQYKDSLISVLNLYGDDGILKTAKTPVKDLSSAHNEIESLGRIVTTDVEKMVNEERQYVKRLMKESSLYHFMALAGMFLLSVLAVVFLIFSVNRPLKVIENAIHKIVAGDYESIPKIGTGDEFEVLVASLNNMIKELNRRSESLIHSEKLASLGTLTSGVAHELNNPLNNISTSVQILLEELEDADMDYRRDLLTETEKQVDRARDIVKALLEFSRERSFSLSRVPLKGLVEDTLKLIKGDLPADVELSVKVPDDIQGPMDGRRIQQVLLNLILNGLQAMEGSGGKLTIRARKIKEEGLFCLQVEDTGKGIPEEDIPRIFDPFFSTKDVSGSFRAGSSSHSLLEQGGTGLGLSICHGILEQHGGRMEVESVLGEGTIFSVFLPLAKEDDRAH